MLIAMTGGQLLVQLSSLPVTLALPSIARDFGYGVDEAAWIVIANLLVLGSTVFPRRAAGRPVRPSTGVLHRHDHHYRGRRGDRGGPGPDPGDHTERSAGFRRRTDTRQRERHAGLRLPSRRAGAGLRIPHHRVACGDLHRRGLLRRPVAVGRLGCFRGLAAGVPDHAAHRL